MTEVEEHLVPETCVQQVQHGMLHTTDVEVHTTRIIRAVLVRLRAGPVAFILQVTELFRIRRIDVAQLVPGGTCPLRHDVGIAGVLLLTVAEIQRHVHPIGGLRQRGRGLGVSILRVEGDRVVVLHIRQLHRQHRLRQRVGHTVIVVHDRERLTPVALTREEPVAQLVLNTLLTSTFADQPGNSLLNTFVLAQTIDVQAAVIRGVDVRAVLSEGLFLDVAAVEHRHDRQTKNRSELVVTLIVRRHRHNRARAVAHEHVIRDEHRHLLTTHRVHGVRA